MIFDLNDCIYDIYVSKFCKYSDFKLAEKIYFPKYKLKQELKMRISSVRRLFKWAEVSSDVTLLTVKTIPFLIGYFSSDTRSKPILIGYFNSDKI